ncbi:pyrroline-5-carboxylate reductase [Candidatus Uhrbacteria bacterium]|nr:pyrroline-5-carboxylate reductase [Candidatus Uhrbacteria bacterium]
MKKIKTIGILGGGVMGELMASNIVKIFPTASLIVCERNGAHATMLQKKYRIAVTTRCEDLMVTDVIILAVKPQDFPLARIIAKKDALVISIMAGVSTATIRKQTHAKKIVRAMPNTPARFGKGFTAFFATRTVDREGIRFCSQLFDGLGVSFRVPAEETINKVTAITGSGPAYLIDTLAHFMSAAQSLGFSKKIAYQMILQTLIGTEALLADNPDPEHLINQIASKGGTTEAALREFEKADIHKIWHKAVDAAYARAQELGKRI